MISAVRKLQRMSVMPPKGASGRFFYITDLFRLTAKDWARLLNELDSLTPKERHVLFHGRDEETEYGMEAGRNRPCPSGHEENGGKANDTGKNGMGKSGR